jgi:hypothetical protein
MFTTQLHVKLHGKALSSSSTKKGEFEQPS